MQRLERALDGAIVVISEVLKAVVNEIFHVGASIVTACSVLFLLIFHRPGIRTYLDYRKRVRQGRSAPHNLSRLQRTSFAALLAAEELDREQQQQQQQQQQQPHPPATPPRSPPPRSPPDSISASPTSSRRGSIDLPATAPPSLEAVEADFLQASHPSGLFEDIRLASLLFIERSTVRVRYGLAVVVNRLRTPVRTIRIILTPRNVIWFFSFLIYAICRLLVGAWRLLVLGSWRSRLGGGDIYRNKEVMVQTEGYPYEKHIVTTDDGYVLTLERIPRAGATEVVYFQHGVFDNSFAWIGGGSASLPYRAHDFGADVWMGNLRGSADKMHSDPRVAQSSKRFWDFSMNEHAWHDIASFVKTIRQVKKNELSAADFKRLRVTAVAHSMGAACVLQYVIGWRYWDRPHGIDQMVLLSPAGIHEKIPIIVPILRPLATLICYIPGFHVFRFPSDIIRMIVAKISRDVSGTAPLEEIAGLVTSRVVGGRTRHHTVFRVPTLTYNILHGTPVKIVKHFLQILRAKRFQAYDYGATRNLKEYGTKEPLNLSGLYHLIDIPVHFLLGMQDTLIPPQNVMRHYTLLAAANPKLAFLKAFANSGHLDFTIGLTEDTVEYILNLLK